MSRGTTTASGDITVEKHKMKWDPKTMEIRTHSVEKTLEPLVLQVSLCCVFIYSLTSLGKIYPSKVSGMRGKNISFRLYRLEHSLVRDRF